MIIGGSSLQDGRHQRKDITGGRSGEEEYQKAVIIGGITAIIREKGTTKGRHLSEVGRQDEIQPS